jgi:hypothetical protein
MNHLCKFQVISRMNELVGDRSVGGSASLKLKKNTKKSDRNVNASKRCIEQMGLEVFEAMKQTWNSLKETKDQDDANVADGMIVSLINQNFSDIEIRACLPKLGGSRLS